MEHSHQYIAEPTREMVLDAVRFRLDKITKESSLGEVILQSESEFNAYMAIVVPKACPACLYDVNAPLEGDWGIATRDELMDNLPAAWLEYDTRLIVEIIDLILEIGVGDGHRFMKSTSDNQEPIYWITSARMICFFHSSKKAAAA
jgi:hypothetical protein